MAIYFRHESPRPFQKDLMDDLYNSMTQRRLLLAHAPTGSGKTDAALSAAITCAIENELDVFFLTPKISQHRIAVDVVKGIAGKYSLDLRAVDMIGRSHCCIDKSLLGLDNDSFQNACARKRKKQECFFYANARGYGRVGEAKADMKFKALLGKYGTAKSHHEVVQEGIAEGACPYEWLIKLAGASDVVIADYYHIMIPQIRDMFLTKIKKRVEDSIIIIDEAHNLAARVRDSMSNSVNTFTFKRMMNETRSLGLDSGPMEEEFSKWAGKMLGKEKERIIAPYSFEEFISSFGITMDEAAVRLEEAGLQFVEKNSRKSACLRLSRFIREWRGTEHECVRVLRRKGEFFFLSRRLLDPSPATKVLNQCASAVLMSGTLLPLEMHRDVLGLDKERTSLRIYPSPFDKRKVVNVITENLTTRYARRDVDEYTAIAKKLDSIISSTPGGSAVFFPSYNVLESVLPLMRSNGLLVQKSSMRPYEIRQLLKDFKDGGVLCGVQGGSLAEGVDYCDGEIKTVVIVGVALEEMDVEIRALIDYYDEKFGRGWDYGYLYPGTIKALQAAGRARRKESDRVAVVYMDERFQWKKYSWILNKDERIIVTENPEREVERFWKD